MNEDDDDARLLQLFRERLGRSPLYPVTIIAARYSGSYEGGTWCAFHCYPHQVPPDATGSDIECMEYWHGDASAGIGRGQSPDDALADLVIRNKASGGGEYPE